VTKATRTLDRILFGRQGSGQKVERFLSQHFDLRQLSHDARVQTLVALMELDDVAVRIAHEE
jgi:hypothetical protein